MGSSSTVTKPEGGVMRIAIEDLGAHVATLEAELRGVRAIELTRGDMVVAELPDFMARLREIYGDKPLDVDTTEWIREGRE
jgi:hypothetical protein